MNRYSSVYLAVTIVQRFDDYNQLYGVFGAKQ